MDVPSHPCISFKATLKSGKTEQHGATAVRSQSKLCGVWEYSYFDKSKIGTVFFLHLISC